MYVLIFNEKVVKLYTITPQSMSTSFIFTDKLQNTISSIHLNECLLEHVYKESC